MLLLVFYARQSSITSDPGYLQTNTRSLWHSSIGPGYPKFAKGGLEWPPYSPDLNPCDYFLWCYIDHCYASHL